MSYLYEYFTDIDGNGFEIESDDGWIVAIADGDTYVSVDLTGHAVTRLRDALESIAADGSGEVRVEDNGESLFLDVENDTLVSVTLNDGDEAQFDVQPADARGFLAALAGKKVEQPESPIVPPAPWPSAEPSLAPNVPDEIADVIPHGEDVNERDVFNAFVAAHAAVHSKTIVFKYASDEHAPIQERTVERVILNKSDEGHAFISGFDVDREDNRAFRIDRIKGYATIK